jgi:transposase
VEFHSTMTIGCDLADSTSNLCVLDGESGVVARPRVKTRPEAFRRFFGGQQRVRVILEASTQSAWIADLLTELGHEVIVANPRRVRLIAESRNKSDEVDAELLARLGRADPSLLSPVQVRSGQTRRDLLAVRSRAELVATRTRLVNHVRSMAKVHAERVPKCTAAALPARAREALTAELCALLEPVLQIIEQVTTQIRALDKRVEGDLSQRYPDVEILQSIPGVGPLTALTFVLLLETPKRFRHSRQVPAFLGLCPGRRQTGKTDPQMRITRTGDRYLRSLLVQCAQRLLGPFGQDCALRRWGLGLASRGGKAAKRRAIVAVARKLAVLMHRLWVNGEQYVERSIEPVSAAAA